MPEYFADGIQQSAAEAGLTEETLALQIDSRLGERTWAGQTIVDRVGRAARVFARTLMDEIEVAFGNQESYDEFESRMLDSLGVHPDGTKAKPLHNLLNVLGIETRAAWNESQVALNQQADTVAVWAAILDDRTTPECWEAHGRLVSDVGSPPAHWGCRCHVIIVPDPESNDAAWAQLGAQILADMAAEREQE